MIPLSGQSDCLHQNSDKLGGLVVVAVFVRLFVCLFVRACVCACVRVVVVFTNRAMILPIRLYFQF